MAEAGDMWQAACDPRHRHVTHDLWELFIFYNTFWFLYLNFIPHTLRDSVSPKCGIILLQSLAVWFISTNKYGFLFNLHQTTILHKKISNIATKTEIIYIYIFFFTWRLLIKKHIPKIVITRNPFLNWKVWAYFGVLEKRLVPSSRSKQKEICFMFDCDLQPPLPPTPFWQCTKLSRYLFLVMASPMVPLGHEGVYWIK